MLFVNNGKRCGSSTLWIGTKEFIKSERRVHCQYSSRLRRTSCLRGNLYSGKKNPVLRTIRNGAYRADHPEYSPDMDFDALENQARRLPLDREDPVYTVVASRSHMSSDTENFIDELKKEHGEVKLTSIGSSIKICLVAEGTADIYPRFAPTMEWDTAAGHAIAKAAGKELYHHDGCTPLAYNKEDLLNPWFIVK